MRFTFYHSHVGKFFGCICSYIRRRAPYDSSRVYFYSVVIPYFGTAVRWGRECCLYDWFDERAKKNLILMHMLILQVRALAKLRVWVKVWPHPLSVPGLDRRQSKYHDIDLLSALFARFGYSMVCRCALFLFLQRSSSVFEQRWTGGRGHAERVESRSRDRPCHDFI